jgi:hypothetical protein
MGIKLLFTKVISNKKRFATLFATQNKKPLDYQGVLLILSGPDGQFDSFPNLM